MNRSAVSVLSRLAAPGAKTLALYPKTEADLTADDTDYTDTRSYDYQCPEVLPRKNLYVHPPITQSTTLFFLFVLTVKYIHEYCYAPLLARGGRALSLS
jgi:hypothetical protein